MPKISILPEHIANQIAAGEVVEGPNSIIKELVENSIDAQATKIYIELSKQLLKIQVIDNGVGMSREDLSLAFKRHATSKIQTIEDLQSLITNGFRGEALASIAAVSKLECISKRKEDIHAHKIYIESGKENITQTGAVTGTNITVDELFFNTPARLKFLKANNKERNLVIDTVRSLAIANSEIAFELKIDGRVALATSGSADQAKAIAEIFADDIYKKLIPVKQERNGISVIGFTSLPELTRSDKRGIFTIINKRIVRCYIMRSALEAVYKELLPAGKYPVAVINLNLDPALVDVNVHPNKQEVKYQQTNQIYTLVGDAVSKAISDSFYNSNKSFQPSIQDYARLNQPQQTDFNQALLDNANHYTKLEERPYSPSITQIKTEAAMGMIGSHFASLEDEPIRKSYVDDFSFTETDPGSKKFLARLGSVEVSLLNSAQIKSQIASQGNRTFFTIVASDKDYSVVMKGDYIGENWLKEKYISELDQLAKEILVRELDKLSLGTKEVVNRSRPNSSPSRSVLEKVWQRDNYTCVYCAKPLLHPDLVKQKLLDVDEPEKLQSHLASYDHHLPASQFPALNKDERNLYASCVACNLKKSDSIASQTWSPTVSNAWQEISKENPLRISNLKFSHHTH